VNEKTKRRNQGFTMIELMVVLIILVLLVSMIVPNIVGKSDDAKQAKAKTDIAMIEALLDQYYLNMGEYPATEEGLRVLYWEPEHDTEKWKGPYSKKPIPKDPWDQPYLYVRPGTHSGQPYEIWSFGRDKQEGGESYDQDIVSWVDIEEE
jgi:general secretion pathway protein G